MKKLNNKGMTLVELIVSFAIVTVAVVYFSQSLITTSKLFKNTKEETDAYVEEVYTYRLLEEMFKEYSQNNQLGIEQAGWFLGFMNFNVYCNIDINGKTGQEVRYKVHKIDNLIIDFNKLSLTKSCDELDPPGIINAETVVSHNDFKNANIWIPINYYEDVEGRGIKWLTGEHKTHKGKIVNGSKLGFTSLKNYFNPQLDLFLSIAEKGGNTYKYLTEFDYEHYIKDVSDGGLGKKVLYVVDSASWTDLISDKWNDMISGLGSLEDVLGGDGFNSFLSGVSGNTLGDAFNNFVSKSNEKLEEVKQNIKEAAEKAGENFENAVNDAKETVNNLINKLKFW